VHAVCVLYVVCGVCTCMCGVCVVCCVVCGVCMCAIYVCVCVWCVYVCWRRARGWSRGRRQLGWIQLGCCVEAPGPGGKVWGARLGRKRGFVFLIVS